MSKKNNKIPFKERKKSKKVAGLLGIFLGAFGIHNFYLGKYVRGILQFILALIFIFTLKDNTEFLIDSLLMLGSLGVGKGIAILCNEVDINKKYRLKHASKEENIEYATFALRKFKGNNKSKFVDYISKRTSLSATDIKAILEQERQEYEEKELLKKQLQEEEKSNITKNQQLSTNKSENQSIISKDSNNSNINVTPLTPEQEQEKLMMIYKKANNYPFVFQYDNFLIGTHTYLGIKDEEAFVNTFWIALYNYVFKNIDNSEKTTKFFKNITDFNIENPELYELDQRFDLVMKHAQHDMVENGTSHEQEILSFLRDIENEYNSFVNPEHKLTYFSNKSTKTEIIRNEANTKIFWLIVFPLIALVICIYLFFSEISYSIGAIGGIISFIWLMIGLVGKSNTCKKCKKWNSLEVIGEKVLETYTTTEKRTNYTSSGNAYYTKEVVTKQNILQTLQCSECGDITQKVTTRTLS